MNTIIENLFSKAQATVQREYENSLLDLRLIIERHTMNRYSEDEIANYLLLFHNADLINFRLNEKDLEVIKYFLLYSVFNFPDRAVLIAKCLKVLFDPSIHEALCAAIRIYMNEDDDTTCELIFAITNLDDFSYFSNKKIIDLFIDVSKYGGQYSKEVVNKELSCYKEYSSSGDSLL